MVLARPEERKLVAPSRKLQVTMGVSLGQARHFTFQNPVTKEEHSVIQDGVRNLAPRPSLQTNMQHTNDCRDRQTRLFNYASYGFKFRDSQNRKYAYCGNSQPTAETSPPLIPSNYLCIVLDCRTPLMLRVLASHVLQ